jgi:endonuclease/exonuclease/phosphatase (EEP) superfamily protein YafD
VTYLSLNHEIPETTAEKVLSLIKDNGWDQNEVMTEALQLWLERQGS